MNSMKWSCFKHFLHRSTCLRPLVQSTTFTSATSRRREGFAFCRVPRRWPLVSGQTISDSRQPPFAFQAGPLGIATGCHTSASVCARQGWVYIGSCLGEHPTRHPIWYWVIIGSRSLLIIIMATSEFWLWTSFQKIIRCFSDSKDSPPLSSAVLGETLIVEITCFQIKSNKIA